MYAPGTGLSRPRGGFYLNIVLYSRIPAGDTKIVLKSKWFGPNGGTVIVSFMRMEGKNRQYSPD